MARVRVIRVLEYSYPDQASYEADCPRWGVPANGIYRDFRGRTREGLVIRSAVTLSETLPEQDEPDLSEDRGPATLRHISGLLSLVGIAAPPGVVETWPYHWQDQAVAWASAAHLSASDNDVEVPPFPSFLEGYRG